MSLIPKKEIYFKVYAIKELLHRGGFGLAGLPPPACLFGFNLFLVQDIHINELEGADFSVEHTHPRSHRRFTNDIDDVSALQEKTGGDGLETGSDLQALPRKSSIPSV